MKNFILIVIAFLPLCIYAQELYVFTEPASNMPSNSIALKLNTKFSKMNYSDKWNVYSVNPEIMWGVNKKLMVHLNAFSSNMFQKKLTFQGAGVYAKYRLYSEDDVHEHFRVAAYGRFAKVNNPVTMSTTLLHTMPDGNGGSMTQEMVMAHRSYEIDPEGEVSALGTGLIATKLINRLAVSATAGYLYRLDNLRNKKEVFQPWHAANWSASAGYLLLPKEYKDFKQTNLNLYFELLGYHSIDGEGYYIDAAPAVQFIFSSIARLDLGYRSQLTGKGERFSNSSFVLKFEYDFLNFFKTK